MLRTSLRPVALATGLSLIAGLAVADPFNGHSTSASRENQGWSVRTQIVRTGRHANSPYDAQPSGVSRENQGWTGQHANSRRQGGNRNQAYVGQSGVGNSAGISQSGQRNSATILQPGNRNNASINQRGNDKTAIIVQTGDNSDVRVNQRGKKPGGVAVYTW